jgi:hypothetical protein
MLSQLNQILSAQMEDIINSSLEHELYDRLQVELVRWLSTSREQRLRQLLPQDEMGERKSSQFP